MEWGVKAIIWEGKKNDLSSSCQQRKRLCVNKREARQRQRCGHLLSAGRPESPHRDAHSADLEPARQWPWLTEWTDFVHVLVSHQQRRDLGREEQQKDDAYSPSECQGPATSVVTFTISLIHRKV